MTVTELVDPQFWPHPTLGHVRHGRKDQRGWAAVPSGPAKDAALGQRLLVEPASFGAGGFASSRRRSVSSSARSMAFSFRSLTST